MPLTWITLQKQERKQDGRSVFTLLSNLRTLEETKAIVRTRLICYKHARCWGWFIWGPASVVDLYLEWNWEMNIWYSLLVKRWPTCGRNPSCAIPVHEAIFLPCVHANNLLVLEFNDGHRLHNHRATVRLPEHQRVTALTHSDRRPCSIMKIMDERT
jgi:hypothetical protein